MAATSPITATAAIATTKRNDAATTKAACSECTGILLAGLTARTGSASPAAFLQARLFPDMFPFTSQVHIATDMARAGAARPLRSPRADGRRPSVPAAGEGVCAHRGQVGSEARVAAALKELADRHLALGGATYCI